MQKSSVIENSNQVGTRFGRLWLLLGVLILSSISAVPSAEAQLYWDTNGATPGAGATPTGTWDTTSSLWNTSAAGTATPGTYVSGSDAVFSAGTDAVNPYTVTLSGTQTANSITFNSSGPATISGSGSLSIAGGGITANSNATISSPIALTAAQTWTVASGEKFTFGSTVSGAFGLTKAGAGTLSMTVANTTANYTSLAISAGTLSVDGTVQNVLSYLKPTSVASGAILTSTDTKDQALVALTLSGGTLSTSGTGNWEVGSTITVNGTATSTISGGVSLRTTTNPTVFSVAATGATSGIDLDVSANIVSNTAYSDAMTKSGLGVMRLSGNNTYINGTTVTQGTLLLTNTAGSATGTGTLTVNSGATLGGTGSASGATAINGIVSPGNPGTVGMLTLANNVTWNGNTAASVVTDWVYQLGTGNSSDNLNISAGNFTKGTGTVFRFNFGGSTATGMFTLVDWTGTTTFSASDFSYTNLGGGDTGTFSIVGNDLDFTVAAVPEPSTAVLPTLLLVVLAGLARRRRGFQGVSGTSPVLS